MRRAYLIAAILCVLFIAPAIAQTTHTVTANIAFDFYVNDTKFPAGHYAFETCENPKHVTIISEDGQRVRRFVLTNDLPQVETSTETKLVFRDHNGRKVLHQIWAGGDNHSHDLAHAVVVKDVE